MYRAYGGWTFAFDDYTALNITTYLDDDNMTLMARPIWYVCMCVHAYGIYVCVCMHMVCMYVRAYGMYVCVCIWYVCMCVHT